MCDMMTLEKIADMMKIVLTNIDAVGPFPSVTLEEAKIQIDTLTHEAFKHSIDNIIASEEHMRTIHDVHHEVTHKYWLWRQNDENK